MTGKAREGASARAPARTAVDGGAHPRLSWRLRGLALELPPPRAAGIVNVTDDSFFEGARSVTPEGAVADGLRLVAQGFDLLDVGAVAARSGPPVGLEDEAGRLVPTIERLAAEAGVPVIADTYSAPVAARAIRAGAAAINDISGGGDPELLEEVAGSGCGYVLTHIEGPPRSDREPSRREDVVGELGEWFERRLAELERRGVAAEQVALDPGFDFDISLEDDLELLARLGELRRLGHPLFVALSRKDFLGAVIAGSWDHRAPAQAREWATDAAVTLAVEAGADVLRLHDRSALDAARVAFAVVAGWGEARG